MSQNKELLVALSNEVLKSSELVMTFRTRVALISWVGPFVVLGSYVIATDGAVPRPQTGWAAVAVALVVIIGCYVGIRWIGSRIEKQACEQCNRLRAIITRLATDDEYRVGEREYYDPIVEKIGKGYIFAYLFIIVSALAIGGLVMAASGTVQFGGARPTP